MNLQAAPATAQDAHRILAETIPETAAAIATLAIRRSATRVSEDFAFQAPRHSQTAHARQASVAGAGLGVDLIAAPVTFPTSLVEAALTRRAALQTAIATTQ